MWRSRKEKTLTTPQMLALFLLIGLFIPLTVILSLVPSSWYTLEGYEDLGIVEFQASEVPLRVPSRHGGKGDRYVVYRALDNSGLSFKRIYSRLTAERKVAEGERIFCRVLTVREKRFFLRKWETQFLDPEADSAALQAHLDLCRTLSRTTQVFGACYIGLYAAAALRRRKLRQAEAVTSVSPDSRPR